MSVSLSSRRCRPSTWSQRLAFVLIVAVVGLGWESPALAYIDPSTSGTLMQIIAPILIALGVLRQRIMLVLRLGFARIRRAFGRDDRG